MIRRLVVVSDLHVAVPGALNNFHAGDALADFVAAQARAGTCLVLAGDGFDFLQVEGRPERLAGDEMPGLINATLDAIHSTDWGRRLFDAFGALLRTGKSQVVVIPGNHDPEVAHPHFAARFLTLAGQPPKHPGLVVQSDGPLRCVLGARSVVVGHGNRHDPWNDIAPETVTAAIGGRPAPLPPGSRLVTRVLNAFKNARDAEGNLRFPFVDLLKPEAPAVPLLLLYLDRRLAREHLPAVLGVSVEMLANKLGKALLGTQVLSAEGGERETGPADDLARALATSYSEAERNNPARCESAFAEWLEEGEDDVREGTLASHDGTRAKLLRAFLRMASDEGRFFDRSHRSEDCVAALREVAPRDGSLCAIIAGHTHAAREVWDTAEHVYLNTGTWTDLMAFPTRFEGEELRRWIDALERGDVPRRRHLTYAEVTPTTVGLREFDPS